MKNENIIIIIGILFIGFLAIAVTSAFSMNNNQIIHSNIFDEAKDSQCSSIILQVSDNESVSSFRRDQENSADIFIVNGTWGDINYIKQYKEAGGDFFQALVTENGYIVGVGGQSDGEANKLIENITEKMLTSGKPAKYIPEVQDLIKNDKNGHFIIKEPNGQYYAVWPTFSSNGKLEPGEYVCCPNLHKYSFRGNFTTDPINESIDIASTDIFGIERRDIITFHYKNNESGAYADVYASNDDGSKRMSDTSNLKDDVYYMGKLYPADSLPYTPNKLYLGTYTFKENSGDFFSWFWDIIHKKE